MVAIRRNSSAIELSVQQMVDCSLTNNGCLGGDTCNLLEWLIDENVAIETMEEYPTHSGVTKCRMDTSKNATQAIRVDRFTCQR